MVTASCYQILNCDQVDSDYTMILEAVYCHTVTTTLLLVHFGALPNMGYKVVL